MMKVLEALARNHDSFRLLMALLAARAEPSEENVVFVQAVLRVLLPALDRHEEIEDIVFDARRFGRLNGAAVIDGVDAQHEALDRMRGELLTALESADAKPRALFAILPILIGSLEEHLRTEEAKLWPIYRERVAAADDEATYRLIENRVAALDNRLADELAPTG